MPTPRTPALDRNRGRRGTLILLVAGLASVIAVMTVAFLMRTRSDIEESRQLLMQAQARMMLSAGLQYISETARLGWDDPVTGARHETFGWCDVRDGRWGPCDEKGEAAKARVAGAAVACFDPATGASLVPKPSGLPPGSTWHGVFPSVLCAARCPLYVMRRPPYAISLKPTENPMGTDPTLPWAQLLDDNHLDPVPVAPGAFAAADERPMFSDANRGWFRVYREAKATFIITCGAGVTQGFRDFAEATFEGHDADFGSAEQFAELRRDETLLWYRVEWNPAVGYNAQYAYMNGNSFRPNLTSAPNQETYAGQSVSGDIPNSRQFGGTFPYIQRLREEPTDW